MKKRILSLALSLALCLGLAVPVLAVGSEWNLAVPDEEKKIQPSATFKLRHWEVTKEDWIQTFTGLNEEIEDFTLPDGVMCPEAGDTLTLTARNGCDIRISAWSDPDGDGVYDQRLGKVTPFDEYVDDTHVIMHADLEVMPINTTGPLTSNLANAEEEGHYTVSWRLDANGEFCEFYEFVGLLYEASDAEWLDVSIPVNYLLEQLGPNTLLLLTFDDQMSGWPVLLPNSQPVISTETPTAYASTQTVMVDGKAVTFECYALKDANGNDTNYIKLRDLAMLLNGSAAQFQVGWDGSVTITTQTAYTPNGSELSTPYSGDRAYQETTATTKVNGQAADLAAFVLNDDAGGGYTYYQLRDLGKALGFNVGWDNHKGIFVETDKPYDASN